MTNPDYTHLALVIDRSGSMSRIANDMNGAITELFKQQEALPGKLRVDVWTFDDDTEHRFSDAEVADVSGQDYVVPRGSTALNDAVGRGIVELGELFARTAEDERPGKVIFAIVTDGEENASREYPGQPGQARVKALLEKQREEFGWEFLFFGTTDIDAVAAAAGFGVGRGQTLTFDPSGGGTVAMAAAASAYMGDYRGSGLSRSFTDEEREAAVSES